LVHRSFDLAFDYTIVNTLKRQLFPPTVLGGASSHADQAIYHSAAWLITTRRP
jgi:hypothetical protein